MLVVPFLNAILIIIIVTPSSRVRVKVTLKNVFEVQRSRVKSPDLIRGISWTRFFM